MKTKNFSSFGCIFLIAIAYAIIFCFHGNIDKLIYGSFNSSENAYNSGMYSKNQLQIEKKEKVFYGEQVSVKTENEGEPNKHLYIIARIRGQEDK